MEAKSYEPVVYQTVQETCARLRISRRNFDRLRALGLIAIIQLNERWIRVDAKETDALLKQHREGGLEDSHDA